MYYRSIDRYKSIDTEVDKATDTHTGKVFNQDLGFGGFIHAAFSTPMRVQSLSLRHGDLLEKKVRE